MGTPDVAAPAVGRSEATDGADTYIRGGGGTIDRRRVSQLTVGFVIAALAVLAAVLAVQAHEHNARQSRLRSHGVPVQVTVTHCYGIASGTGITQAGYSCAGRYTLGGRPHVGDVAGTSADHRPGTVIDAVVDPRDPANLSSSQSVASSPAAWHAYIAALATAAVLVALVGATLVITRRRRTVAGSAQELPAGAVAGPDTGRG
jgi:hypothetical protein